MSMVRQRIMQEQCPLTWAERACEEQCVSTHERTSELASWRGVASVGLKTVGCAETSTERDLRKRGAGEALDARQPLHTHAHSGNLRRTPPAIPVTATTTQQSFDTMTHPV